MPNFAYIEIPAENVDRARTFYHSLLGWKIEPTKTPMDPAMAQAMQYQDIMTGEEMKNTVNMGGLYKRQMDEKIVNYVLVEDIDKVLAKVEKLGGTIAVPKREIPSVGKIAIIQDTEENTIGLWESAM